MSGTSGKAQQLRPKGFGVENDKSFLVTMNILAVPFSKLDVQCEEIRFS